MSVRLLLPLVAALLLVLPAAPAGAEADAEPVTLENAQVELNVLTAAVRRSKSINEEINGAMEAVELAYHNLQAPEKPELEEVPEGASEEEKKEIDGRNAKATKAYESAMKAFGRSSEKYKKDAEKQFLKAFKLEKIHKSSETNTRDDVNIKAAQVLGNTGNPKMAGQIIKTLEKNIFKSKIDASTLLLEEAFGALGKLNQIESLEWMIDSFTHSKSSPRTQVDRLIAAHKAMILFPRDEVPGKVRYKLVQEMVKTYSGVESQANQSSTDPAIQAKKDFWDRIKGDTIKVVQYYTYEPTNEDSEVLATMEEFRIWFKNNKNAKKDPWKDEKKPAR